MARVNAIARFAIERRVTMLMAVLAVLVLGWMSLHRLPLEFLPTFSSSSISVSADYPSSSPQEVERLIVQPLEDSLGTINGIETMSARASAGDGSVSLTFVDGTDMDLAAVDVRDRIDRVRHLLPGDLNRIRVRRFQSTDIPVVRFHVTATWPREKLFDFVETTLQPRLERLPGVAAIDVRGIQSPSLHVDLDRARMQAHGVSVRDLTSRIRNDNQNLAAGEIKEGGHTRLVRAAGELRSLEELERLPLNDRGLKLADVAEVNYRFPTQESFNFLNGTEALTVRVNKVSTSNLLEVVDGVKAELAAIQALPDATGLTVRIYRDSSVDVRKGLAQLRDSGIIGGVLAILAVFLFVRQVRTTLLVAIAIPVSVVTTFVIMYFLRKLELTDITLNVVSLAGLMLALGMLVDSSVVVIESIFRHRNDLGEDAKTAALMGTSEVALPIIASTLTTLCVFLPLIFFSEGGWTATSFKNIATTVSIVIAASLLVALTVVPLLAVPLLRKQEARKAPFIGRLIRAYGGVLGFTLRHRFVFMMLMIAVVAGSEYLLSTVERTFSMRTQERQVTVQVDAPRQFSLDQTHALYREVFELLDTHRDELEIADITYSYDVGTGRARGGRRHRRVEVYLKDEEQSQLSTSQVRDKIRALLPIKAGAELKIAEGRSHGRSSGIEIELSGTDLSVLEHLAGRLTGELADVGLFKDVDTSLESGDEEIHVRPTRDRMLQSDLSSQAVAATISSSLSSRALSHFKTDDREIDIVVQFREADRATLEQLQNVPVVARAGQIPLGAIAEFAVVAGPRAIERENHLAKVTISANLERQSASFMAMRTVSEVMGGFPLPPGYSWSLGRWNRMQQRDQVMSEFALGMAIVLVYLLMAALFESFAQPLTILVSIPFARVGVAIAMKLAGQPLDTMATLGLVILIGVVVNNAIVLLDHVNQLRRAGLPRTRAIIEGGQHRLRPILITAVTTVLGLLPMVAPLLFPQWLGPLEGRSASWAPIGLVIMGGLTTSTVLTLLVVPIVYSLVDDATRFLQSLVARTDPNHSIDPTAEAATAHGRRPGDR